MQKNVYEHMQLANTAEIWNFKTSKTLNGLFFASTKWTYNVNIFSIFIIFDLRN
jgi:hypothetical protein